MDLESVFEDRLAEWDDSGHEYVIPADKVEEWEEHILSVETFDYEDDDAQFPDDPEWAEEIGGHFLIHSYEIE